MVNRGKCSSKKGSYFGEFYAKSYKFWPHPVGHSPFKATNKDTETVWVALVSKYLLMIFRRYLPIKIFCLLVGF